MIKKEQFLVKHLNQIIFDSRQSLYFLAKLWELVATAFPSEIIGFECPKHGNKIWAVKDKNK